MKRSLIPNKNVKIVSEKALSKTWTTLDEYIYEYTHHDGRVERHKREVYNRGDGVTALLFNPHRKTVILVRQFRFPTFLNGNESGYLIEACAGKLEAEGPITGIVREIEEETGHKVLSISKVFEAYMSPGSVTELIHFFVAEYSDQTKFSQGGGLHDEQENIEVLEIPFLDALELIKKGEIKDAKTIMLLQYAYINQLL